MAHTVKPLPGNPRRIKGMSEKLLDWRSPREAAPIAPRQDEHPWLAGALQ
jgi:hypothetical protein